MGALLLLAFWAVSGCRTTGAQGELRVAPLPVQQIRAYPETVTRRFVSLSDFEDSPTGPGHRQVDRYDLPDSRKENTKQFVVNITRTGAGAMRVTLLPGAELVFNIPDIHDFTGYTLLSMALHIESLRDDLCVTLDSDGKSWRSHRTLVRPGWNTVSIDIQRLASHEGFAIRGVRKLRLYFADAAGPITFHLDDIMLVDNRRQIAPIPEGVSLHKAGLDYRLLLRGHDDPMVLQQCPDGLWRLGENQPIVQVIGVSQPSGDASGERIGLMGTRRVAQVDVLENNPVRLRLANTWYFPSRSGEWVSMAVRQIRWEYTFYADGRWITHVRLNNSGGKEIQSARIFLNRPVAWAGGAVANERATGNLPGPVLRWSWLVSGQPDRLALLQDNFIRPARLAVDLGVPDVFAAGDADRDGFDESQGCYFLTARAGHCRFVIVPNPAGLVNPVFRIAGKWSGPVSANSEGMPIRNIVRGPEDSVIFVLPGWLNKPTRVEVSGKVALLDN